MACLLTDAFSSMTEPTPPSLVTFMLLTLFLLLTPAVPLLLLLLLLLLPLLLLLMLVLVLMKLFILAVLSSSSCSTALSFSVVVLKRSSPRYRLPSLPSRILRGLLLPLNDKTKQIIVVRSIRKANLGNIKLAEIVAIQKCGDW